jgi:hypothetical protein
MIRLYEAESSLNLMLKDETRKKKINYTKNLKK